LGLKTRKLYLVIGIVVILAIVCSPALAISKSDLISQYKGQSSPTIPTVVPTTTPTTITIGDVNLLFALLVNSTPMQTMVFLDGSYQGFTPISIGGLSAGTHQLRVSWPGYETYLTEVLIPDPSCHIVFVHGGLEALVCEVQTQTINVTLKKVESTLKPTIPTVVPTTAPIQTLIPTHYIYPWMVSLTTAPTPIPSHTPCLPGTPYWICLK
jgi:hypothetical protein